MTKKDLERLKFTRVEVSAEESGGEPYYYYVKEVFENITLISEAVENPYEIKIFSFDSDIAIPDQYIFKLVKLFEEIGHKLAEPN